MIRTAVRSRLDAAYDDARAKAAVHRHRQMQWRDRGLSPSAAKVAATWGVDTPGELSDARDANARLPAASPRRIGRRSLRSIDALLVREGLRRPPPPMRKPIPDFITKAIAWLTDRGWTVTPPRGNP